MQVTFETVCLSPFYNFFLIICAVHGRLKCLLWYMPNVPPNHGMLQRCRPHPLRTIKPLELDPEEGMSFSNANPMTSGVTMRVGRRDSVSLPEGLFEFFYRDGSSVFIPFASGGLTPKHIQTAADTRSSLVYKEVTQKDSLAYQEALDCVDGLEDMDSDVSDDEEGESENKEQEHEEDLEGSEQYDKVESASLMTKGGVEMQTGDPKRKMSKDIFRARKRDTDHEVVTQNDNIQL